MIKDTLICKKNICKICFKEISNYSFFSLLNPNNNLCEDCFSKFSPKFIHFKIENYDGLAIYEYDQNIKELLYTFKGCYDYELKDVFLDRYIRYLRMVYHGYIVVPIPSYYLDDDRRGFNHVIEIYNRLKLKVEKVLIKTKKEKQANKKLKDRVKVGDIFTIRHLETVKNKKVLIVDDVMTTGSSIKAAINLIKQGHPKKIKVLVVARGVKKVAT